MEWEVIIISYKMICIDMDGTLLNRKHKISEKSKTAIRKAHNMGVHVVVCTGRLYADAEAYSDLIGVKSPIIASNGAVIRGVNRKDIIYKSIFDEELCTKILNIFFRYNLKPIINTPEKSYCGNFKFKLFIEFIKLIGGVNKSFKTEYVSSQRKWPNILKEEKNNIVKCEVINMDINKLIKIRKELEANKEIEIVSSTSHNIEVTKKGISKGKAIEILADHYNIKREEIIAIGDSENDLSMIEFAGTGIAMGNAIELVKQKADYVTETNDNDGVAEAINKFVLKKVDQKGATEKL